MFNVKTSPPSSPKLIHLFRVFPQIDSPYLSLLVFLYVLLYSFSWFYIIIIRTFFMLLVVYVSVYTVFLTVFLFSYINYHWFKCLYYLRIVFLSSHLFVVSNIQVQYSTFSFLIIFVISSLLFNFSIILCPRYILCDLNIFNWC